MFKQLGISIGIMIVLIIAIVFLRKKEQYANAGPYSQLDYVANRNAWKSNIPIALK